MNDLEPWKIWAITGALVCAILGSAAARVRPIEVGESTVQANTQIPDERAPGAAVEPPQSSDQYEAYFSGYSHTPFSTARYSGQQSSVSGPDNGLLYTSAAFNYDYHEPELDVAQQILGSQPTQPNTLADNKEHQITDIAGDWRVVAVDYPDGSDGANESTPGWVFPAVRDDLMDLATNTASPSGDGIIYIYEPDLADASGWGHAITNGVADLSEQLYLQAANTEQALTEDDELEGDHGPVITIKSVVRTEASTDLPVVDELQMQAAQALIQAKVQADLAALQQAETLSSENTANAYSQFLGNL